MTLTTSPDPFKFPSIVVLVCPDPNDQYFLPGNSSSINAIAISAKGVCKPPCSWPPHWRSELRRSTLGRLPTRVFYFPNHASHGGPDDPRACRQKSRRVSFRPLLPSICRNSHVPCMESVTTKSLYGNKLSATFGAQGLSSDSVWVANHRQRSCGAIGLCASQGTWDLDSTRSSHCCSNRHPTLARERCGLGP